METKVYIQMFFTYSGKSYSNPYPGFETIDKCMAYARARVEGAMKHGLKYFKPCFVYNHITTKVEQ